jgi:UDP-2,3-diacylglucosamine pyrophosphatase LpxH
VIIDAPGRRMVVISDMHVGNPFSEARANLGAFLDYVKTERFDLCINGDAFEILQTSFSSLARDSIGVLNEVRDLIDSGRHVYYVVGNHDLVLEHFLETWAQIHICPFLNVTHGDVRIRVEHGHLYDPFFMKHPDLYEFLTRAAGPLLHVYPDVYYLWSYYQSLKDRLGAGRSKAIEEAGVYYEAAEMLLRRGFDAVVFGHTHKPEDVALPSGRYLNSGNWMRGGTYIEILDGVPALKRWEGRSEQRRLAG